MLDIIKQNKTKQTNIILKKIQNEFIFTWKLQIYFKNIQCYLLNYIKRRTKNQARIKNKEKKTKNTKTNK